MSQSKRLHLSQLLWQLPELCRGLPARVKGLHLASQRLDDRPAGLLKSFQEAVKRNPQGAAVIYDDRHITYETLDRWSNRIANVFRKQEVGRGDVLAVFIENRPELLAIVLGLAKVGAIPALLNTSQRGRVLVHSIQLVEPCGLVVGQELVSAITDVEGELSHQCKRWWVADADTLSRSGHAPEGWCNFAERVASEPDKSAVSHIPLGSDSLCYFYTSGTTGMPKAAILSNGRYTKAVAGVGMACVQLRPDDRVLVPLPFYHGTAMVVGWGSALAGAAGLVMVRRFSASRFWQVVREHRVSAFCYVGELCRYLLAQAPTAQDREHPVHTMFGNGLRPGIWREFKARFGIKRVLEFYGSSEGNIGFLNVFNVDCTVGFTTVPYAIVEYDLEQDAPRRFGDGFMRRVKVGEAGLLLGKITEDTPFDGYTDQQKTEATILRNVFEEGDAWFNTGDLMRDMGYRHAQFVDRLGDTFRWKGENVSTTEVENLLAGHSSVVDAVVYGVEIPHTNGRAGMLAVRSHDGSFDPNILLTIMKEELAPYAIPLFVREVKELATTGTHKYQKKQLKDDAFNPEACGEALWVLLPGADRYTKLDATIYKKICSGGYGF
ncbi:MAG: long-chain-acyl-CoA synthetase [Oleiphilaceae bacterium]|nr:long-chain-acyl-CoA synthetase [Oleiphilaceae bacterium]